MKYENYSKAKEIVEKIDDLKKIRFELNTDCEIKIASVKKSYVYIDDISEYGHGELSILTKKYLDAVRLYYDTEIDALHKELEKL